MSWSACVAAAVSAVLLVELDGFGVEEAGGVGSLVGVGDGNELVEGGFEGGVVVLADGGTHEVAVALFTDCGGGEAFAGRPDRQGGVVGLEG